jgi:hypothetical protein
MRHRTKLAMSALVAALALSAAVTTVDARRIELSNQRFLAIWEGLNKLTFENSAGTLHVACRATLEGSFHSRTLSKVSSQLIGYVTSAAITRPCEGGDAWFQNGTEEIGTEGRPSTLPWHIRYDSFAGLLPNITSIRVQVVEMAYLVHNEVLNCLYETTAAKPAVGILEINAAKQIESWKWDETKLIPVFIDLEIFRRSCTESRLKGRGAMFLQGSLATRIVVRLVQ